MSSKEHMGSTFTFVLPCNISPICDNFDDPDDIPNIPEDDITAGFFQFRPRALSSVFSSNGPTRDQKLLSSKLNGFEVDSYMFPVSNIVKLRETSSTEDACSVNIDAIESNSEPECSQSQSPHPDDHAAVCKGMAETQPSDGKLRSERSSLEIVSRIDSQEKGPEVDDGLANGETPRDRQRPEKSLESTSCGKTESLKNQIPRILLVEDNKINVMVTQSMMKRLGHKMDVVNNGVEAICAVQHTDYDLILMVIHTRILVYLSCQQPTFSLFPVLDIF